MQACSPWYCIVPSVKNRETQAVLGALQAAEEAVEGDSDALPAEQAPAWTQPGGLQALDAATMRGAICAQMRHISALLG